MSIRPVPHSIDVVIGSSFGGAVALELLQSGAWSGPAVLLCPAHRLVAGRAWLPSPSLPQGAEMIVVVHGTQDETVPVEHSRALVRGTAARLIEVEDRHRLALTATLVSATSRSPPERGAALKHELRV